MKHVVLSRLFAFALLLTLSALSGVAIAQAQGSNGAPIPVCVLYFESTPGVEYLTQAQIDEIEATWAAYDGMDIPPAQITGYPDPITGSCATENGDPASYDPESYTLVCVRSGPEGDGPLVPQLAINIYLGDADDVILADPVTGDCPQEESSEPAPAETASEEAAAAEPATDDTGSDNAAADDSGSDNAAPATGSSEESASVPQAVEKVPEPEGRAAAIYTGSCDELDAVVTELPNIVDPQGQLVGQSSAIEAATASTSVDVSLDALLDENHAIVVFDANTLDSDMIACGDIGGVDNDDGELVVGLREADGSGFTGMVYLAYSAGDGSQTDVSIFLADGLTDPRQ